MEPKLLKTILLSKVPEVDVEAASWEVEEGMEEDEDGNRVSEVWALGNRVSEARAWAGEEWVLLIAVGARTANAGGYYDYWQMILGEERGEG